MTGVDRDVDEAIAVMESLRGEIGADAPASDNAAKRLAQRLHDRLPVIYGAGPLTEVAHRWKTQLNESSKVWCFFEELPELHHNATVGIELPARIARATTVVMLRSSSLLHPRVRLRYDWTRQLLEKAGVDSVTVDTQGKSALAQIMSSVLFGDYVSGYLALLYGVDPSPTAVIAELRAWLAQQP